MSPAAGRAFFAFTGQATFGGEEEWLQNLEWTSLLLRIVKRSGALELVAHAVVDPQ